MLAAEVSQVGTDIDDDAVTAFGHAWEYSLAAEKYGFEIAVEDMIPFSFGNVEKWRFGNYTGVIDQYVDLFVACHHLPHLVGIGDICFYGDGVATLCNNALHYLLCLLGAIQVIDDDECASLAEHEGDSAADTGCGAGDDGGFVM